MGTSASSQALTQVTSQVAPSASSRASPSFSSSEIGREQARIFSASRLSRVHWLVLSVSVAVTFLSWTFSREMLIESEQEDFERRATRFVSAIERRIEHYEDALRGGAAAFLSHPYAMDLNGWRDYTETLDLAGRYPGVLGMGWIASIPPEKFPRFLAEQQAVRPGFTVRPEHDHSEHLVITYLEPVAGNEGAIGLDIAFDPERRRGVEEARELNLARLSPPFPLMQDDERGAGVVLFFPLFNDKTGLESVTGFSGFLGVLNAPMAIEKFLAAIEAEELPGRHFTYQITDQGEVLHSSLPEGKGSERGRRAPKGVPTFSIAREIYGRIWRFEFEGTQVPAFSSGPLIVLLSGLGIDATLLALFLFLSNANRRVTTIARDVTDRLGSQGRVLEEMNASLERFAYTVSHDLKTPLRGIEQLTAFMKEDLDEENLDDIALNLARLRTQSRKARSLIDSILAYSLVGAEEEPLSWVDSRALVNEIGHTLNVAPEQLLAASNLPYFETHATRFEQVLTNLITNAFRYHPDPASARVRVDLLEDVLGGDVLDGNVPGGGVFEDAPANTSRHTYRFAVTDNGAGIEPRFHQKIFEPFTSLQANGASDSSGIGLAIVKKAVSGLGGTISVESNPKLKRGTSITFDWPAVPACHLEKSDERES